MSEIKGKTLLLAIHPVKFTSKDTGEVVKGTQLFVLRNAYENELNRGWVNNMVVEKIWIADGSSVKLPAPASLPCPCELIYTSAGRYNYLSEVQLLG